MTQQEMMEELNRGDVTVYQPDTFDLRGFIDGMAENNDFSVHRFVPIESPGSTIDFTTDFHLDGESFCTVSVGDENGGRVLLSEDDRGKTIGHINEVEHYLAENCSGGFYDMDEAASKIDGYEEKFELIDQDYLDYIEQLAKDTPETYEPFFTDATTPIGIEYPKERDMSKATLDEQAAWIKEGMKPGGFIDMVFKDMDLEESMKDIDIEKKFEDYSIDRTVSEKTKDYFSPSAEKQPYFDIMKNGFIPFEIREGYLSKNPVSQDMVLTKDIVNEVRQKIDPEFGKVCGVDTTAFHTKRDGDVEKNVSIIPLTYGDIKPHIGEYELFHEDDVQSVRVIKEYGEGIKIQGEKFNITNLATFEVRTHDKETYRSTLVMDDSGTARARLDFIAVDLKHSFRLETGNNYTGGGDIRLIHFDKLDRTNIENPGHFRVLEGKGEAFKERFLSEVEDRLPGFFSGLVDRMDQNLAPDNINDIGRKDYMELNMGDIKSSYDSMHNVTNIVELYKENLEAKAYSANCKAAFIEDSINLTDMERKEYATDSKEYETFSEQIDKLKGEYAKSYSDYTDNKSKYERVEQDTKSILETYRELGHRYDAVKDEYGKLFEGATANGTGVDTDNSKLTPEERFSKFCDIALLRSDLVPTEIAFDLDKILDEKGEIIEEAYEAITDVVEKYNATIENDMEKIVLGELDESGVELEDGGVYTASGYEVEAHSLAGDTYIGGQYVPYIDREDYKEDLYNIDTKPDVDENGNYDFTQANLYADKKPEGTDKTRKEIRDDFQKNVICDGNEKDKITLMDNSLSSKMMDTGLLHELKAIKHTVDMHPDESFQDFEKFKDEIDDYKKSIDNGSSSDDTTKTEKDMEQDEEDASTKQDAKDERDSSIDKKISGSIFGAYGKVDESKKVEISEKKLDSLKQEAIKEAKETGKDKDAIFKEKVGALQEKLDLIKSDILHYKGKMDGMEYAPRIANRHITFQTAKMEFDSAIRAYQKLGGKVGADTFVTRGVNAYELALSKSEVSRSDYALSFVLDKMHGIDTIDAVRNLSIRKDGTEARSFGGHMASFTKGSMGIAKLANLPVSLIDKVIIAVLDLNEDRIEKVFKYQEKDSWKDFFSDKGQKPTNDDVDSKNTDNQPDTTKDEPDQTDRENPNDVEKPEDEVEKPEDNVEKPESETEKPEDDVDKTEGQKPDTEKPEDKKQETEKEEKQDTEKKESSESKPEKNDVDAKDPDKKDDTTRTERDQADKSSQNDVDKHAEGENKLSGDVEKPKGDVENPKSDVEKPEKEKGAAVSKDEKEEPDKKEAKMEKDESSDDAQKKAELEKEEKAITADEKTENLIENNTKQDTEKPEDDHKPEIERPEDTNTEKDEKQDTEKDEKQDTEKNEKQDAEKDEKQDTEKNEKQDTEKDEKKDITKDENKSDDSKKENDKVENSADNTEKEQETQQEVEEQNLVDVKPEDERDVLAADADLKDENAAVDVGEKQETEMETRDDTEIPDSDYETRVEVEEDKVDAAALGGEDLTLHDVAPAGVDAEDGDEETNAVVREGSKNDEETIKMEPDGMDNTIQDSVLPEELLQSMDTDIEEEPLPQISDLEITEESLPQIPDVEPEDDIFQSVTERIEAAVSGEEELDVVLADVSDKIVDGFDPMDMLDAMVDGLTAAFENDLATLESIGDAVFEFANLIGDAAMDTLDVISSSLLDGGVPQDAVNTIEEQVANLYDALEGAFEDTCLGEYDVFEFGEDATYNMASGTDDIQVDLFQDINAFTDEALDRIDLTGMAADMDALGVVGDLKNDLENQGVDSKVASDVSSEMYDQILQDASNGVDVTTDEYMKNTMEQSMNNAQNMVDSDLKDDTELQNKLNMENQVDNQTNPEVDNGVDNATEAAGAGGDVEGVAEGVEAFAVVIP